MTQRVRLARVMHFSSGHSYRLEGAGEVENRCLYGDLFQPDGFGHNFKLEAHFEGSIDPDTGMTENLAIVDGWMKDVVNLLDHRYLNRDVEFFKTNPPTSENIARFCFEEIQKRMTSAKTRLFKVRLYEGDSTWADIFHPDATEADRDF
jgi:6-pyruvoyltetrahydropterin/6-carboxytetrahydropterin synthase